MAGPRTTRDLPEMLEQLDRQLSLLEQYSRFAFEEGRTEYYPEIAAKLRILIVRSRQNAPLLFRVAEALQVVPRVTLNPSLIPRREEDTRPREITLDEFFDLHAMTLGTSDGPVSMTKRQLIRAWCEQLGGVHEDWEVDEALIRAVRMPAFVMGMQMSALELRSYGQVVLEHGDALLDRASAGGEGPALSGP